MIDQSDNDSIEEDIVTQSCTDTPVLGGGNRKHGKTAGMNMPPLAPKMK